MGINETIQAERRPQIIRAAARVIARNGFQNTTLNAVAKEAGLSKGGLVHYFPTKEEMIITTFVEFFDNIFALGKERRDQHDDPLDRILSFAWIFEQENPDLVVGGRVVFDFTSLASQEAKYLTHYNDWVNKWLFFLEEDVKAGIRAGKFKDSDPVETAKTISAIYEGIGDRRTLLPQTHSESWAKESLTSIITQLLVK